MTRLRLQSCATNRGPTRYTVNLDGVPLGCDGLFNDPALVITVGSEVAKDLGEGAEMKDSETLDKAKALFTGATQGDLLAREVIAIAERLENMEAIHKAGCVVLPYETEQALFFSDRWIWNEDLGRPVKTVQKELADLRAQRDDELWSVLAPLKDAVLYARSQRRPMGIGQDCPRTAATARLDIGLEYGRTHDNAGFWIDSDELGPQDAESPDPAKRIALALLRLAHSVTEKVKPRP